MRDPIETSELLAFTKIVESKSLSRAAAELGAPRATIGRRLARLEERLGVRLLRRTTRSLALTDAGDTFYRHARIALDAVTQAEASLERDDAAIRGTLRVALPPMLDSSFHLAMSDFARRYPEVQLELGFSSRYVDLVRDGYDVALRASTALEPGLVARTVARAPLIAVASAKYLEDHGTPSTARELRHHRLLVGFARGELPQTLWPRLDGKSVRVSGALSTNDLGLLTHAALSGLGIALLPTLIIGHLVERGELVRVLPGIIGAESRISIVHPERELVPPHVRAFVEHLTEWARKGLSGAARPLARLAQPDRGRKASAPAAPEKRVSRRSRAARPRAT